jgi:adenine-specific DNA-methyltransferase
MALAKQEYQHVGDSRILKPATSSKKELDLIKHLTGVVRELERSSVPSEKAGRIAFFSFLRPIASEVDFVLPFEMKDMEGFQGPQVSPFPISAGYLKNHLSLIDIAYEEIVSSTYRKKHGQFITPHEIAEFMTEWSVNQGSKNVLDPAVGTGVFFEHLIRKCRCRLTGMDIDPLMLNACALRLKLMETESEPQLLLGDFFDAFVPAADADLVICNPPYLNFHDFDSKRIVNMLSKSSGIEFSKLTNIYSLFFVRSHALLRNGGSMAFITPSEFFYTGYGKKLKSFLVGNYTIAAFVVTDFEKLAFNKALTTSVITLLRKQRASKDHNVKFILVSEWPGVQNLLDLVEGVKESMRGCKVKEVPQRELNPLQKWQIHFGDNGMSGVLPKMVPLSKIAKVNRGIATGANNYFAMSDQEVRKWEIEPQFLSPVISRAVHAPNYDYTKEDFKRLVEAGKKTFLLYCFSRPSPALSKYIARGEELGMHRRYLPSHRGPWFSSEKQESPPILASVFSRRRMRFILNEAGVRTLTAFHCIYPASSDIRSVKALLAYLNSGISTKIQEFMRREYGGGLHKFEPADLEELLVLDTENISDEDKEGLSILFDELCTIHRNSPNEEPQVLSRIDQRINTLLAGTNL